MTTIETPAPTLGVGRCLGFILGGLPWPDDFVTRITLVSLVPEHLAAANRNIELCSRPPPRGPLPRWLSEP